jgi:hypothetical protein
MNRNEIEESGRQQNSQTVLRMHVLAPLPVEAPAPEPGGMIGCWGLQALA